MLSNINLELTDVSIQYDESDEFIKKLCDLFKLNSRIKLTLNNSTDSGFTVYTLYHFANAFSLYFDMDFDDNKHKPYVILKKTDKSRI